MRYFHNTKNKSFSRTINVDKIWTLVPKEEKEGLTADSEVVPVIDTVTAGYTKVLGNGMYAFSPFYFSDPFLSVLVFFSDCFSVASPNFP